MACELDRLSRELPLPPRWSEPEVIVDRIDLGGVSVRRAGIVSGSAAGVEVTGSAAEAGDVSPLRRAWLEVLERIAIVNAGDDGHGAICTARRRSARSNGVAVQSTWERACRNARLELIERDRVLRSWYGEIAPQPAAPPLALRDVCTHEWVACTLDARDRWGPGTEVAAVVGFPLSREVPLARGFAARESSEAALAAAGREALQSLAFLWGEPIPDHAPAPAPTPIFHLDHYLYPDHHARLRDWLAGGHRRFARHLRSPRRAEVRFVDITPGSLASTLRVARALSNSAAPLVFGDPPDDVAARLPPDLRVHPIS